MRVRVYDKKTNTYFKSDVYAIINTAYDEKLLLMTSDNFELHLKFYEYLDKTDKEWSVLINTILPDRPDEWISARSNSAAEQLNKFKSLLKVDIRFFEYIGPSWLWQDTATLIRLLMGDRIPLKGSIFEKKLNIEMIKTEWNYVETQADADLFMKQTCNLHDSVIKDIYYISGIMCRF